jgi:anti-anti-sigma factor
MAMHLPQTNEGSPFKIAGTLDIYDAGPLRETLLHLLEAPSGMVLDLSDVEECDLTAIQLFCAARKSAESANKAFVIHSASSAVVKVCAAIGVTADQLPFPSSEDL